MKGKLKAYLSIVLTLALLMTMAAFIPSGTASAAVKGLIYSLDFDDSLANGSETDVPGASGTATYVTGISGKAAGNTNLLLPENIISELTDYTISAWFKPTSSVSNDTKLFSFGDDNVRYMYFKPSNSNGVPEFVMTNNGVGDEQRLIGSLSLASDTWYHLLVTQRASSSKMYINGVEVAQLNETEIYPYELGDIASNAIQFDGAIDNFKIYNTYLDPAAAADLATKDLSDADAVSMIKGMLYVADKTKQKLDLFKLSGDVSVSWASDKPDVIDSDGWVTRPVVETAVTLTATIKKGAVQDTVAFTTIVPAASSATTTFSLDYSQQGPEIMDTLFGAFFEDINWAGDAGLYPEKFTNRSFEYFAHIWNGTHPNSSSSHNRTNDATAHRHGWMASGDASFEVMNTAPYMNENNKNYAKVTVNAADSGLLNYGYGNITGTAKAGTETNYPGMSFKKGDEYTFSMWVRGAVNTTATVTLYGGGTSDVAGMYPGSYVVGTVTFPISTTGVGWQKVSATVTVEKDVADASGLKADGFADVIFADPGTYYLDFISLYPKDTFNNRENGLRPELIQILKDMNPGFLRFPGGCVSEGVGPDNRYNWKKTVGPVEERQLDWNLWCEYLYSGGQSNTYYYQSFGLGYYEYMLLCEDIECAPVPVFNAGIACELRETGTYGNSIYAGGVSTTEVDMEGLQPFIDDAIDFIEFCNGDPATNEWAALRAEMGHPESFNLEYVAIGNEQQNGGHYLRYFDEFEKQIHALYPDIKLIHSSGRSTSGSGYQAAYDWMLLGNPYSPGPKGRDYAYAIDEHGYYSNEATIYSHSERYNADVPNYVRGDRPYAFFGEYALRLSSGGTRLNSTRTAVAEAALMTGFEKNADIVAMASYAPLFAKDGYEQWTPDAIWFSEYAAYGSAAYYNQKMYGNHVGDYQIPNTIAMSPTAGPDPVGTVGIGTYGTAAVFDDLKIVDDTTGQDIANYNFNDPAMDLTTDFELFRGNASAGSWSITQDGYLSQTGTTNTFMTQVLKNGYSLNNYTLTVKAKKTGGTEGFVIPFLVNGTSNYYWFNIGGWSNTQHAIEKGTSATARTQPVTKAGSIETDRWYNIKVVLNGKNVKCYLDDELLFDYNIPVALTSDAATKPYSSATFDEEANEIIIRAINPINYEMDTKFVLENVDYVNPVGRVFQLGGITNASGNYINTTSNTLTNQRNVYDREFSFDGFNTEFYYTLKPYSSTVFRISLDRDNAKVSYVKTASMTKAAGTVPKLPAKVDVALENGGVARKAVTWEYKPDCFYDVPGVYKISGDVEGTSFDATLLLTLEEAAALPDFEAEVTSNDIVQSNNAVQGSLTAVVTNNTDVSTGAVVFVSIYNSNGALFKANAKTNITLLPGDNEITVDGINAANATGSGYYAKVFVWTPAMVPLTEVSKVFISTDKALAAKYPGVDTTLAAQPTLSTTKAYYPQHDGEIVYGPDTTGEYWYWDFSTDQGSYNGNEIRKSKDLVNWQWVGTAIRVYQNPETGKYFHNYPPGVTLEGFNENTGTYTRRVFSQGTNFWAPYVFDNSAVDGYYYMYYCFSAFGTRTSDLGVYRCKALDGVWEFCSVLVQTRSSEGPGFNAIDPMVVRDQDGRLWLTYGSFFYGIAMVELDSNDPTKLIGEKTYCLSRRDQYDYTSDDGNRCGLEGSTIVYNEKFGYYYLLVSYDYLANLYNTRVGRSKNITGPYYDANGNDLNYADRWDSLTRGDVGTKIIAPYAYKNDNHQGWVGTGHCSFFVGQDGEHYITHNSRPATSTNRPYLNTRRVIWTEDGWPLPSSEVTAAEKAGDVTQVSKSAIAGNASSDGYNWEFIRLERIVLGKTLNKFNSVDYALTPDGKINANGSWNYSLSKDGTANLTIDLGGTGDIVGKVYYGWDWENWKEAVLFVGKDEDNTVYWGKRGLSVE